MKKKALLLFVLVSTGCTFAMRYPWDKQQDTHATQPVKAVPSPSPEASPAAAKLHLEVSPLDEPDIKIAARRHR